MDITVISFYSFVFISIWEDYFTLHVVGCREEEGREQWRRKFGNEDECCRSRLECKWDCFTFVCSEIELTVWQEWDPLWHRSFVFAKTISFLAHLMLIESQVLLREEHVMSGFYTIKNNTISPNWFLENIWKKDFLSC